MNLPTVALVLVLGTVSTACASGNSGSPGVGTATDNVGFSGILGSPGFIEVTNDVALGESIISANRSAVWSALPSVFETLGIETPRVDPRSLSIGNPGYRAGRIEGKRLSTYLECGRGVGRANADQYVVTLQLMVQLEAAPDEGTTVRTLMEAYARSGSVSGNSIPCRSKGTLERRVIELIAEELANDGNR